MLEWVISVSDNTLPPVSYQGITRTNADLLSVRPLGANLSDIQIQIQESSQRNAFQYAVHKMAIILFRNQCVNVGPWTGAFVSQVDNQSLKNAADDILLAFLGKKQQNEIESWRKRMKNVSYAARSMMSNYKTHSEPNC